VEQNWQVHFITEVERYAIRHETPLSVGSTRIDKFGTHAKCVFAAGCPHPSWKMPLGTKNNMNTHYEEASSTGKPSKSENQTFHAVSLAGEVSALVSKDVDEVQFAPSVPGKTLNSRAKGQTDKKERTMKGKHSKVATSDNDVTQETLSERSMGRDAVAVIRGVNTILREASDGIGSGVFKILISMVLSTFCDADAIERAYDVYRKSTVQGSKVVCLTRTGKE